MASLPLKVIVSQYEKAKNQPGRWHESPTGYWSYMKPDGSFLLSHYGTIIFDYDPNTRTYAVGGTTNSDRDAINSMLLILGLDDKASNAGGDMTLRNDRKQNSFNVRRSRSAKPANPGYNGASRPEPSEYGSSPYAKETFNGFKIKEVYFDIWESSYGPRTVYDVVAVNGRQLIWGKDYDPMSGLWLNGYYDQTPAQIKAHAEGHRLIASYDVGTSSPSGKVSSNRKGRKTNSSSRKSVSGNAKPKASQKKGNGKAKGKGSCNTKPRSKASAQPRKANGQFARKPKGSKKGGSRR